KVTMPYKVDDLTRRVSRVAGVTSVVNRVEVLPVSRYDDEPRLRIARASDGNPTFWHYAAVSNPALPAAVARGRVALEVAVERGRVTLEGVVNSDVEKHLARALAIGFGELSVENRLKTEAEVTQELEQI